MKVSKNVEFRCNKFDTFSFKKTKKFNEKPGVK